MNRYPGLNADEVEAQENADRWQEIADNDVQTLIEKDAKHSGYGGSWKKRRVLVLS